MAEFSALPIFTDAYLADTDHLSFAEHGAYLRLLMLMWRTPGCRVPNDDPWLARRLRITLDQVREFIRPLIVEFCKIDGNWITQKRLSREHGYVKRRSMKQSDSAKQRWRKEKDACHPYANTVVSGNAPTPTLTKELRTDASHPAPASPSITDPPFALPPDPKPPSNSPLDLKAEVWRRGKALLVANHIDAKQAGNLLGKWRKLVGDAGMIDILARAEAACPSAIIPWIEGALKANDKRNNADQAAPFAERMRRVREEMLAGSGMASPLGAGRGSGDPDLGFQGPCDDPRSDDGGAVVLDGETIPRGAGADLVVRGQLGHQTGAGPGGIGNGNLPGDSRRPSAGSSDRGGQPDQGRLELPQSATAGGNPSARQRGIGAAATGADPAENRGDVRPLGERLT